MIDIKIIDENIVIYIYIYIYIYNGTKYIAKETDNVHNCTDCAFKEIHLACGSVNCASFRRDDKREVIFVYIPKSYDDVINEYKQSENLQSNILPKKWEEFCDKYPVIDEYYISSASAIIETKIDRKRNKDIDKILCSTKQTTKAFLTLIQLVRLRDVYNANWVPNWVDDKEDKYVIETNHCDIVIHNFNSISSPLYFKSLELAKKFLNNFRDLIEEAKELI